MIKFKSTRTLYFKLSLYFFIFITIMLLASIGIIYFWSFHYFSHIFEDKVIEMHTSSTYSELKIKDEWILGVTAKSINLVEAIHGSETAEHIYNQAQNQLENSKLYRELVNGKYLMYMIDIDYQNGEKVYKYSIIKDIYKEIFPKMLIFFIISLAIILFISLYVIRVLCKHLTSDLNKISDYAHKIASQDWNESIDINTNDEDILLLVSAFNNMKDKLIERENIQQSMLQYISHELKTPIMIISSYTEAAKENIFPNGDLNTTLNTIMNQTDRINHKVEDLLFISKLNNENNSKNKETINLSSITYKVITNFKALINSNPNLDIILNLDDSINILGYKDQIEVAFENIIENQLRYCDKKIYIRIFSYFESIIILFYNDGLTINIQNLNLLFSPFQKGIDGKYGLGLSICKKVFQIHDGEINFIPTKKGCLFKIDFKNQTNRR